MKERKKLVAVRKSFYFFPHMEVISHEHDGVIQG
jgi:hypothetical protein